MSKLNSRVRFALFCLNQHVDNGMEYPDAEERVIERYSLTGTDILQMREAYDSGECPLPANFDDVQVEERA